MSELGADIKAGHSNIEVDWRAVMAAACKEVFRKELSAWARREGKEEIEETRGVKREEAEGGRNKVEEEDEDDKGEDNGMKSKEISPMSVSSAMSAVIVAVKEDMRTRLQQRRKRGGRGYGTCNQKE